MGGAGAVRRGVTGRRGIHSTSHRRGRVERAAIDSADLGWAGCGGSMSTLRLASRGRGLRWALVLIVAVMALLLVGSSYRSYDTITTSADALVWGRANLLAEPTHHLLRQGPPTQAALDELVQSEQSEGLRYVAVVSPDGELRRESGAPLGPLTPRPAELGQPSLERIEQGVRFSIRLPPRPPASEAAAQSQPTPEQPIPEQPKPEHVPPSPTVIIDFVPMTIDALAAETRSNLVVSIVVAVLMLVAAFVVALLITRAEREQEREKKRQQVKASAHFESTIKRTKRAHMETLGQMSAVLAHEIRNPLASLKGHAQLLLEKIEQEPKLGRKAHRVVDEAVRLETLTNTLLDFARASTVERRDVDPTALLQRAVESVDSECIEVQASEAPARWSLDSLRMEQVLVNLLQNAVQAGGEARVDAMVQERGDHLEYTVRDRGAGLEGADPAELFTAFHTTKVHGTGLGLAVVKRIVDLHGGRIEVEDHSDGGAVFRVMIPSEKGTPKSGSAKSGSAVQGAAKQGTA